MNVIGDFKFAFRQLLKSPGFTISAAIVLALGIGVNTLFFAPPAYSKPQEMVQLFSQDKKDPKKFRGFSYPTYLDVRQQNTVFSDVMGFNVAFVAIPIQALRTE
jgi:macrolide transport system ATP-binding/permease protein